MLFALLIAALAVGPAFGASQGKPRRTFIPPAVPAGVDANAPAMEGLRGPLDAAPAGVVLSRSPIGLVSTRAALPASSAATGLGANKSVGDPAPICRAECAKVRTTCAITESDACDFTWSQCVATCSSPALR